MRHITSEAKQSIIEKAINRGQKTLDQVAKENNVGYSTLTGWLKLARLQAGFKTGRRGRPQKGQDQTPPLQHLLTTSGLDEEDVGVYCREPGIYNFQLEGWRNKLMKKDCNEKQTTVDRNELKSLKEKIKHLERDLHRKDKALAETSALLVLKKKADLIWGDLAED
jgi:transposase